MNKKLTFASLTFLLGGLLLSSCGAAPASSTPRANANVTGLSFVVKSHTFEAVGETFNLHAEVTYKTGTTEQATLTWRNTNSKAVGLSYDGLDAVVIAKSIGSSTVSAMAGNFIATCTFTVKDNSEEINFDLDSKTMKLKPGSTGNLSASVNGVIVSEGVTWSSGDESVATVIDGVVTAVSEGQTDISARYNSLTAKCHVTVSNEAVEFEISVDPTSKSLKVGETFNLTVTTNDPSAVVTVVSSNALIASYENGVVTANKKGTAVITASANGKSATCNVTVTEDVDPQKVVTVYFYLDYNNIDPEDETGTKKLAEFKWYQNQPLKNAPIPADPTTPTDPAFPYFIGWSSHTIIDSKNDLWDIDNDVPGIRYFLYLYGIWSDVPKGDFNK